jgi:membrane protease YdiL (CAAX protease family)
MKSDALLDRLRNAPFWMRAGLTFLAMVVIEVFCEVLPWLDRGGQQLYFRLGVPPSEAAFLTYFTFSSWLAGLGNLFVLWLVVRIEKPADWKAFLTLDRTDWRGIWIVAAILVLILALDALALQRLVWQPIQNWLMNLGLWTERSLLTPPRAYFWLNLVVLLLMSWLEMAEEVYFRGYLQRQITARRGAFWGIALSTLLWDLWHIKSPASFVRRFFVGLVSYALVAHVRRRVWGPMVGHPLGNRINAVLILLRP